MPSNTDLSIFLPEATELVGRFCTVLEQLKEGNASPDAINDLFRILHTVKGSSAIVRLSDLERVAHHCETLLNEVRTDRQELDATLLDFLLETGDQILEYLAQLQGGSTEPSVDLRSLTAQIDSLCTIQRTDKSPDALPEDTVFLFEEEPSAPPAPKAATTSEAKDEDFLVRVRVGLLNKLMDLMGELVLVRNQVLRQKSAESEEVHARLDSVVSEVQDTVMKTRLSPLSEAWRTVGHTVRQTSRKVHKNVRLETLGQETELDRTLLETLKEPTLHLIRNAIDHGIESPEERKALGKKEQGVVTIEARQHGDHVTIEISDDGKGMCLDRIRDRAITLGLLSQSKAESVPDEDILQLIFAPGLSTAEQVSELSGRGVGLDVVKSKLEGMGGHVRAFTKHNEGSTIRMEFPLTLAIIPALRIAAGPHSFALPQLELIELVKPDTKIKDAIVQVQDLSFLPLRDDLLPLIWLSQHMGIEEVCPNPEAIVILEAQKRRFGLVIDAIESTEEIVVKPLDVEFQKNTSFAGATNNGDGGISVVLNVEGLAKEAGIFDLVSDRPSPTDKSVSADESSYGQQTLILVRIAEQQLLLPMQNIRRFETFPFGSVEILGSQKVVQYDDRVLPIYGHAEQVETKPDSTNEEKFHVVVYQGSTREVGLVVDEILDVLDEQSLSFQKPIRESTQGVAIVGNASAELIDPELSMLPWETIHNMEIKQ